MTAAYASIPWASGDDVQCEDHAWAPEDHDGARIHVCGLAQGHDGQCVCVDCCAEFDGGAIQDERWGAEDMVGRPWRDAGEADPGLLLVVLGVLGAVVLGAVVVAAAAGVFA